MKYLLVFVFSLALFSSCNWSSDTDVETIQIDTMDLLITVDSTLLDSLRKAEDSLKTSEDTFYIVNVAFEKESPEDDFRLEGIY